MISDKIVFTGAIINESCATGASISVVSEPRAVATGSYAQLGINTYFGINTYS